MKLPRFLITLYNKLTAPQSIEVEQELRMYTSGSYFDSDVTDSELEGLTEQAISIFRNNKDAQPEEVVDKIRAYRDDEALALALYRFIPIAYCRLFIPQAKYSDQYVLYKSEDEKREFSLSSDRVYGIVQAVCKASLNKATGEDDILPILFHSSAFSAINNALNGGANLADLEVSPSIFMTSDDL